MLDQAKEQLGLEEFSVSQTTLDDVSGFVLQLVSKLNLQRHVHSLHSLQLSNLVHIISSHFH